MAIPRKTHKSVVPHQIRIIGGNWKRTPLPVLDQEGLRPTPDRVRETTFNWLTHLLDGEWSRVRCLDLFAGTGALGMEAASRGAVQVTMIESSPAAVRQLESNKARLKAEQVSIIRGDAARYVEQAAAQGGHSGFDVIFLDPPYRQNWLPKLLPACRNLLPPGGFLYAEAEMALGSGIFPELEGWDVVRADRAGMVFYHVLQPVATE